MKKILCLFLFFLMLGATKTKAQNIIQLFPAQLTDSLYHGEILGTTLENTDATGPVAFYIQTAFDTGMSSTIFVSTPAFVEYIRSQGNDLITQTHAVAKVLKSDKFVNNFESFGDQGNPITRSKKFSAPVFALSFPEHQCAEYSEFGSHTLFQTGVLSPDSTMMVSSAGVLDSNGYTDFLHSTYQVKYKGHPAHCDLDPGEPFLLNHLESGDYFSASDIQNDSAQLHIDGTYQYCDQLLDKCGSLFSMGGDSGILPDSAEEVEIKLQNYYQYFHSIIYSKPDSIIPRQDSGIIILPSSKFAKCTINFSDSIPFVLSQEQAGTVFPLLQSGNISGFLDTLVTMFQVADTAAVMNILRGTHFVVADPNPTSFMFNNCRSNESLENQIFCSIKVTTYDSSVVIGRDIRFPFLVHCIITSDTIELGDTVIGPGTTIFNLMNMKGTIDDSSAGIFPTKTTVPQPSNGQVQTLQAGLIPAHTTVQFICYWNPLIYNFFNGMKAVFMRGNPQKLSIKIIPTTQTLQTDISNTIPPNNRMTLYPNPANSSFFIGSEGMEGYKVIMSDLTGREVKSFVIDSDRQEISIDAIAAGVYLISAGGKTKKLIVQ